MFSEENLLLAGQANQKGIVKISFYKITSNGFEYKKTA